MTDKVSIVIPVYNSENYFAKCINSVLAQNYKNLEIIIINDGSTDRSLKLCRYYAEQDSRIVLLDKENGGVSSARNAGMKQATGKYLMFLDSDDFLPPDAVEKLHQTITRDCSDLAFGGYTEIGVKRNKVVSHPDAHFSLDKDSVVTILQTEGINYICSKLYHLEHITANRLWYNGQIKVGEDEMFICEYLKTCASVSFLFDNVYFYNRLNETSATSNFKTDISFCFAETLKTYLGTLEYFGYSGKDDVVQSAIEKRFTYCLSYIYYFKDAMGNDLWTELKKACDAFAPYIHDMAAKDALTRLGQSCNVTELMRQMQGFPVKQNPKTLKQKVIALIARVKIKKIYG